MTPSVFVLLLVNFTLPIFAWWGNLPTNVDTNSKLGCHGQITVDERGLIRATDSDEGGGLQV
jgi:hypothetical protein